MPRGRPRNTLSRFIPLVKEGAPDECWPFTGKLDKNGYGKFRLRPEYLAHRTAYRMKFGPIPEGGDILHKCDNPPCCNPAHLFLGDHSANMQDMWNKNRHRRPAGELNNHAKLTSEKVEEIRRLYGIGGITQKQLAEQFGVTQTSISGIVRRATWIPRVGKIPHFALK